MEPTELLIRAATVIDGTGAPARVADVLVAGDRVTEIGDLGGAGAGARTVVDAEGLVLAPGFIDTHTHDDFAAVLYPDMAFKASGGVTTCVVGNCGMGAAPWRTAAFGARMYHPGHELPQWDGYGGYLAHLDEHPPAVNVATLIGHGTVRGEVLRLDDRPPDATELDRMRAIVAEGMDAGCLGISTGLIYEPSRFATTDEIVALAEVVAARGGIYTSHIRNEGERLVGAIDEAVEVGRRAGLPVVISHLKSSGRANWGHVGDALTRIDEARADGLTVNADQYPYTASSTVLMAVTEELALGHFTPGDVMIASTEQHPEWHGRTLADLASELDVDPDGAAAAVLASEPLASVVTHAMSEDDVRRVISRPDVMVGSDGLPSLDGHPHPRLWGTFPRVLGRYARDQGVLTLEAAVHKMTGRSAAVFGLTDRGVIRPGALADLVLFDADTVADRATYDDPQRPAAGIERVWVNGVETWRSGAHTGARAGRALRRA